LETGVFPAQKRLKAPQNFGIPFMPPTSLGPGLAFILFMVESLGQCKSYRDVRHEFPEAMPQWAAKAWSLSFKYELNLTVLTSEARRHATRTHNCLLIPKETKSPAVLRRAWQRASQLARPLLKAA
jgi:hypothetical protein